MFHKALEKDLLQIFGLKSLHYGTPAIGKEQDVLFVTIEDTKIKINKGKEIGRIYGRISVIGLIGKNRSGFLLKKIDLADIKITERFVFERTEVPIVVTGYEERFNTYSVDFIYFYKSEYNPPAGKITEVESWVVRIINTIKGVFKNG